jgi:hypothetical protein
VQQGDGWPTDPSWAASYLAGVVMDFESVESSVREEISTIPQPAPSLAAAAVALAREMDDPDNSATSKSMCGKALLETMKRLRELSPPAKKETPLDELSRQRAARRGGAAA